MDPEDDDMDLDTADAETRVNFAGHLLGVWLVECKKLLAGTGKTSLSASTADGAAYVALVLTTEKTNGLRAALDSILTPREASAEKEQLYAQNGLLRARIAELEAHINDLTRNPDAQ